MKRCPICNRLESDNALAFCRADGTPLVRDPSPGIAGANEIETSLLPTSTADGMQRVTAATTALDGQRTPSKNPYLNRSKKLVLFSLGGVLVITLTCVAFFNRYSHNNTASRNSIVVLPLVNANNDTNTEYLSDGISEALINSLTEIQQLKVIARSTAFRYKGKDVDAQQVGRELNVQTVLMGRVIRLGDNLDVQVDLVDATTGAQLWGKEYERKTADVLSVKQTIAREVTETLRLRLTRDEQRQLTKSDTTNAEAYQFYLRGRYYWNKRTGDALKNAIEQFQQAIDKDPTFARGYVGLADSYVALEQYAGVASAETLPKARAAVDQALAIDNSLAEAHASSASIYQRQWQWPQTEQELKYAISLNPNYPTAHHFYAYYFYVKRQFDEATREIKRAHELDPLSPVISENVAMVSLLRNDLDAAIEQCQKTIQLDPKFADVHYILGFAYLKKGRNDEATAEFQRAVDLSGRASTYLGYLGYCYGVTGRRPEALAILKELEEKYSKGQSSGLFLAGVYTGLGDKDHAFAWLEKDFQQRSGQLPTLAWRVHFESLRSDPRYVDLLRRMGLSS
jgi:TolB-like protein/Flp pilus assembly protein TadD